MTQNGAQKAPCFCAERQKIRRTQKAQNVDKFEKIYADLVPIFVLIFVLVWWASITRVTSKKAAQATTAADHHQQRSSTNTNSNKPL